MNGSRRDVQNLSTISTREEFASALNTLRLDTGLTFRELAKVSGVPFGTISGWCHGAFPQPGQRDQLRAMLRACGVSEDHVESWLAYWRRLRNPLDLPPPDTRTPYRGLERYEPEDAEWFFGRGAQTRSLIERVTDPNTGHRLVVVLGASGSGKSSLLRAGLIASVRTPESASSGKFLCLLLTPGSHPVAALAEQLAATGEQPQNVIEAELRTSPAGCIERVRGAEQHRLLLVVDQFEELFTMCDDEAERHAFLTALQVVAGLVGAGSAVECRVVIGVRADFYAELLRYPFLVEAVRSDQIVLGTMGQPELREAILEPARRVNIEVEDGLVQLLLSDLSSHRSSDIRDAGTLPLLSHALLATWERSDRRVMTVQDYLSTGGVQEAIARTAEDTFAALTASQQNLARQVFLRLVHVGLDTPDTRRRVRLDELTGQPGDDAYAETRTVLGQYIDRRLITADVDTVEISHEALLVAWPRLREWINADRAGHRVHRQLTESAQVWRDGNQDPSTLLRGSRLAAAGDYGRERAAELNALEREFLAASVAADTAERTRERRRSRRLAILSAALAVLLLAAGGLSAYAFRQQAQADQARDLAVSRQVAGTANRLRDTDPALAAQLAVAAYRFAPTVEARSALIATSATPPVTRMTRPGGARQSTAVSPDGALLATAGAANTDTTLLLWDLRDAGRPVRLDPPISGHTAAVYAATFSPDGRTLATGSADKTVRLWNVSDPRHPTPIGQPLTGADNRVLAVGFSPNGQILAAGGADKLVRLWDVRDPDHPVMIADPLTGANGSVQALSFGRSGTLLAAADAANAVQLWDISDIPHPRRTSTLTVPSRVNTVAFTPDGTTLAAGSNDRLVHLWRVSDPARPISDGPPLPAATGWVNAIAFSSDGQTIAVANADNAVQVWNLVTRSLIVSLPHPEPVTGVAFRDQDQVLITNSADGIARRWVVPGPVIPTADRSVTSLAIRPGGTGAMLAEAGTDIRLWDVSDQYRPTRLGPPLTAPPGIDRMGGTVAINPDGRTLAGGTRQQNLVVLWDISDPRQPTQLGKPLAGHTALIENVQFSPDGHTLATGADDGTVRLWDVTDPRHAALLTTLNTNAGNVFMTAFSPNGHMLAAATQAGTVHLWDVQNPRIPIPTSTPITVSQDYTYSVTFSPDGRTLASGSANGTVRLWNISDNRTPTPLGEPITGPDGYLLSLAIQADNHTLAAGSGTGQTWIWDISNPFHPGVLAIVDTPRGTTWDLEFTAHGRVLAGVPGDIRLWNTDPDQIAREICATAGDAITPVEWAKHAPGADYRTVCL